jgi:hypothetical protein
MREGLIRFGSSDGPFLALLGQFAERKQGQELHPVCGKRAVASLLMSELAVNKL